MDRKKLYKIIIGYVVVVGSAAHIANAITPGIVLWGVAVPFWASIITLFVLGGLAILIAND
tara:strand:- start:6659 stop:6841 length:183 start_codon:yes stop_codon:yes gene_type:complete